MTRQQQADALAARARAERLAACRSAAAILREWHEARKRKPGYYDSTSPNTRAEFETAIADMEAGRW